MTLAPDTAGPESPAKPDVDPASRYRRAIEGVIGVPATEGNRVDVLRNGDEIFPAMLDAIGSAENTIDLRGRVIDTIGSGINMPIFCLAGWRRHWCFRCIA